MRLKDLGSIKFDEKLKVGFSMRRYKQFGTIQSLYEWVSIVSDGGRAENIPTPRKNTNNPWPTVPGTVSPHDTKSPSPRHCAGQHGEDAGRCLRSEPVCPAAGHAGHRGPGRLRPGHHERFRQKQCPWGSSRGAIFSLADHAFGVAANCGGIDRVAVSVHIQYLVPATGDLVAVANRWQTMENTPRTGSWYTMERERSPCSMA